MPRLFAAAILVLFWTAPVALATPPTPANDPFRMGPDRAVTYTGTGGRMNEIIDWWCADVYEHEDQLVYVVTMEFFGFGYSADDDHLTRDEDGNVYVIARVTTTTGEARYYDPPLMILSPPLAAGKTWESVTTAYDNPDLEGEGEPEHHRFTVAEPEVWDLPGGEREVFKVWDDPAEGQSYGRDWYANGLGKVQIGFGDDGPTYRMTAVSDQGAGALAGIGKPYELKFGWKSGQTIHVQKNQHVIKIRGDVGDTTTAAAEYDLKVNRIPTGLLIHRDNLVVPGTENSVLGRGLIDRIGDITPDFIIGDEGGFVAATNLDALLSSTQAYVEGLSSEMSPEDKEAFDKILQPLMTRNVLSAAVEEEWNHMVGMWLTLAGKTRLFYEGALDMPVPAMPDLVLPTRYWMGVSRYCPCSPAHDGETCVVLNYTSTTDTKTAAEMVAGLVPAEASAEVRDSLGFSRMTTNIYTVMDPDTMLPFNIVSWRTVVAEELGDDGQMVPVTDIRAEYYWFSYED